MCVVFSPQTRRRFSWVCCFVQWDCHYSPIWPDTVFLRKQVRDSAKRVYVAPSRSQCQRGVGLGEHPSAIPHHRRNTFWHPSCGLPRPDTAICYCSQWVALVQPIDLAAVLNKPRPLGRGHWLFSQLPNRSVEFMIIYRNLYLFIYFLLQRSLLTQSVSLISSPQAFYVSAELTATIFLRCPLILKFPWCHNYLISTWLNEDCSEWGL